MAPFNLVPWTIDTLGVEKFDRFPRLLLDIKRPENDMIPPLGATVEKSSYDLKEHSRLRIVFCSKYSLFSSKSIVDISKKKLGQVN